MRRLITQQHWLLVILTVAGLLGADCSRAYAQGGIVIDVQSVQASPLRPTKSSKSVDDTRPWVVISLRSLFAAVNELAAAGQPVPPEMLLLDGLMQPTRAIASADDLLIAGPVEPLPPRAEVAHRPCGSTTGWPAVQLGDLHLILSLLQTNNGQLPPLGCSLDVAPEAWARAQSVVQGVQLPRGSDAGPIARQLLAAFGPQQITLYGVPSNSRLARTFVEADYVMKCLTIGELRPKIDGWKSHLDLKTAADSHPYPRWWFVLAPGLSAADDQWARTGPGVVLQGGFANAEATASGEPLPASAEKFLQQFANRWDALCNEYPALADLRNVADLTVLLAQAHAQWSAPAEFAHKTEARQLPETADTVVQVRNAGRRIYLSVGGVVLDSSSLVPTADESIAWEPPAIPAGQWRVRVDRPNFRDR